LYDLRDVLRNTPQADHAAVTISQWNMYILPQLVDVLVSNDLMSKVLVLKQGNSGKYEFETKEKAGTDGKEEPQTSNTAGILNKMLSITVNGNAQYQVCGTGGPRTSFRHRWTGRLRSKHCRGC
jgi:hypothetical protein